MISYIKNLDCDTVIDLLSNKVEYRDFYISKENFGVAIRDERFITENSRWDSATVGELEGNTLWFYPEYGAIFRAVALSGPPKAIVLQATENLKISRLIGPMHCLDSEDYYQH